MASSSSFGSNCPRWKYDVFLSFRGEDTRNTFTGHLYEYLKNNGIDTFQDDKKLNHGDSITEKLLKAIEESQVSLIVFSKNYGTSRWCLNELVKIMECKDENGQTVIPVFYDVDPSDVRNQKESFAEAFSKYESKYKDDVEGMQKVQRWRTALTVAADLKGYDIRDGIESEKILQIVDFIPSKLCKSAYSLSSLQDVVGINAHFEKLKSLLQIEINDVRIVGIWGIGGVGKTTIAKAFFDFLSPQFTAACFLVDVKENAKKNQLHSLQNTLLSELLRKKDDYINNKYDGKCMIPSRLCSKKVLIVLDDIDHSDHLEYLAGDLGWFGNGSRVVVTTRNRHLIEKDDAIYEVSTLPDHEAMQLFNRHAFKKDVPDECFKDFSLEVVNHAKGLPLALKVWGSLLHKRDISQWRITVDKIKKNSSLEIIEKLKISYDGLELEEQKIFLDMACFFRGYEKKKVMQILESCDFVAEYGLDILIDKSLVFISKYDTTEMHDLIQDMGRYVVKIQKDSGEQSRLWDAEDFEEVMVNNTGTKAMEAIWLRHRIQKLCFRKKAMKNMKRLRILYISGFHTHDDSIEYLPNSLRWFDCFKYPWESLPENFEPKRLVHLKLQHSSLRHLWIGTKQLKYLRNLDLSGSESLIITPDFTGMPNLENVELGFCSNLEEVHHSLGCSRKLIELNLCWCVSLERFPCVNVESLESLNLQECSSLEKFPEMVGTMKLELHIYLQTSGLRTLPSSILMKSLVSLNVSGCKQLESLPEEIGDLENLEELDAKDTLISQPPSSIVRLNKLTFLMFGKSIKKIFEIELGDSEGLKKKIKFPQKNFKFPQVNGGLRSLKYLDLSYCNLINGGLPKDIGCLSSLDSLDLRGNNFDHLPPSMFQLCSLRFLNLSDCKSIKELPDFMGRSNLEKQNLSNCIDFEEVNMLDTGIRTLNLTGLENLVTLPRSICELKSLVILNVSGCVKLENLPEEIGDLENLEKLDAKDTLISQPPSSIIRLNKLTFLKFGKSIFKIFKDEIEGSEGLKDDVYFEFPQVNGGLRSLEHLDLSYCNLINGGLPEDIGCLSSLDSLNLGGNNFDNLPGSMVRLCSLRFLDLSDCKSLKNLPDFKGMLNLETLNLSYCMSLGEVDPFPEFLTKLSIIID